MLPETLPDTRLLAGFFSQVVGQLAFALCDELPPDEEPNPDQGVWVLVSVGYDGHAEGLVACMASHELGVELTAAALGVETREISPFQVKDFWQELMNVTCGQWLSARYGTTPLFGIRKPRYRLLPKGRQPRADRVWLDTAWLCVEGMPVWVGRREGVTDVHP
jgi:hypothetical protein